MNHYKSLIYSVASLIAAGAAFAQTTRYTNIQEDGMDYRLRNTVFFDTTLDARIPAATGTVGYVGDGRMFMTFIRFSVNNSLMPNSSDTPIPFEQLQNATSIVFNTGVTAKEYSRTADDELGGALTDWFVVADHFNTPGFDLDALNLFHFDVPNHPNAVFVEQLSPVGIASMPGGRDAPESEFNIQIDVTAAVKKAIADGLLTAESESFSIAAFPVEVPYWNADTSSYIAEDPGHNPHRNWGFQFRPNDADPAKGYAYLEVTTGGETWNGYAVDENGWANTEGWMGFVNVIEAPWIYLFDLNKYAYIDDDSGWIYLAK